MKISFNGLVFLRVILKFSKMGNIYYERDLENSKPRRTKWKRAIKYFMVGGLL